MLKKCYLLILMVFLLSSCAHRHSVTPQKAIEPTPSVAQQVRTPGLFDQVDASGRINVTLHTGYKHPQLILRGDPRDLSQVRTVVSNNTLFVSLGAGFPHYGAVSVDIRGGELNKFRYVGAGELTGSQLNTRFLDMYLENQGTTRLGGSVGIQDLVVKGRGLVQISGVTGYNLHIDLIGSPKVQMSGLVNLAKLEVNGAGSLSLYWVNSKNLRVLAKNKAKIQLAGRANRLEVDLWGMAQFKGRYLRAQRSFVKTHNQSVVELSSVNHQSSLSTDSSNIYYYNIPNTRADFMGFNGSTLDLRDLASPYLDQEYTRYNKQFP
jgi:hypothetical protein